ncbi:Luminal-binding protein [Salix suchowensis]|nr:Luminal-binding protein [Salix suchowensis]
MKVRKLADQNPPKTLARISDLVDPDQDNSAVCGGSRTRNKATPLYQRVLSALIVEDGSEEFAENSGGRIFLFNVLEILLQKQSSVDGFSCNGSSTTNRTGGFHNNSCNDHLVQGGNGFMHSKTGMFPGIFENSDEKSAIHSNVFNMSAYDCHYEQLGLEEKLLMELQSVGLYPETVPDLADGEDESINEDIIKLQKKLKQVGKKEHLDNLTKAIEEGRELQEWPLEQVAMDKLVELAHRKQLATKGNNASKFGVPKVSKQVALAFTRRTLAKCRKFEDTGRVVFDPGASGSFTGGAERHDLHNAKFGRCASLDQGLARTGPIMNRGKKKELLLDDVGGNALFKTTSSLSNALLGGAKGKRSERERDKDVLARNSVTRGGRPSQSNTKGDRKTKSKPRQKIAQLSASGDGIINKFKETGSNKKREVGATSNGSNPVDSSKESRGATNIAEFQDLDSIELHEGNDFSDAQDLNSLFDGLPENDFAGETLLDDLPLQIPMDDLSMIL